MSQFWSQTFANPKNLTNDLLILNSLKVNCDYLPLRRALKQIDTRLKCDNKNQQVFRIFKARELSVIRKDSTIVGLAQESPTLDP